MSFSQHSSFFSRHMVWRMDPRHDLRIAVQCQILFSGNQAVGEGTVCNISTGGWQVETSAPIPRGASLALRVSLPDGGDPMDVKMATVRWSTEMKSGLKNMILGESEWKRLRRFVVDHVADLAPAASTIPL